MQTPGIPRAAGDDPEQTVRISHRNLTDRAAAHPEGSVVAELADVDPITDPTGASVLLEPVSTALVAFDEERARSEANRLLLREKVLYHIGQTGALFERIINPGSDLHDISVSSGEEGTMVEYTLPADRPFGPIRRRATLKMEVFPRFGVQFRTGRKRTSGRFELNKVAEATFTRDGALTLFVSDKK